MARRGTLMSLGVGCLLAAVTVSVALKYGNTRSDPPELSELYPVELHGKWGYIDATGRIVIEPKYDHADYFHGLGLVEQDGRAGYVNRDGSFAIVPQYFLEGDPATDLAARPFWDGLAAVRKDGAWGFIRPDGSWAIPPKFKGHDGFEVVGDFHGGYAWFRKMLQGENGEYAVYGFINKDGEVVVEPTYPALNDFGEGLAGAVDKGYWGFINLKGHFKVRAEFDGAGVFSEGLAPAKKDDAWGFIDHRGKWAIEPTFEEARSFFNGLAPARSAAGWGYIDPAGKWVIRPRYDEALWFEGGMAQVKINGRTLYVDRTGTQVWPALPKP